MKQFLWESELILAAKSFVVILQQSHNINRPSWLVRCSSPSPSSPSSSIPSTSLHSPFRLSCSQIDILSRTPPFYSFHSFSMRQCFLGKSVSKRPRESVEWERVERRKRLQKLRSLRFSSSLNLRMSQASPFISNFIYQSQSPSSPLRSPSFPAAVCRGPCRPPSPAAEESQGGRGSGTGFWGGRGRRCRRASRRGRRSAQSWLRIQSICCTFQMNMQNPTEVFYLSLRTILNKPILKPAFNPECPPYCFVVDSERLFNTQGLQQDCPVCNSRLVPQKLIRDPLLEIFIFEYGPIPGVRIEINKNNGSRKFWPMPYFSHEQKLLLSFISKNYNPSTILARMQKKVGNDDPRQESLLLNYSADLQNGNYNFCRLLNREQLQNFKFKISFNSIGLYNHYFKAQFFLVDQNGNSLTFHENTIVLSAHRGRFLLIRAISSEQYAQELYMFELRPEDRKAVVRATKARMAQKRGAMGFSYDFKNQILYIAGGISKTSASCLEFVKCDFSNIDNWQFIKGAKHEIVSKCSLLATNNFVVIMGGQNKQGSRLDTQLLRLSDGKPKPQQKKNAQQFEKMTVHPHFGHTCYPVLLDMVNGLPKQKISQTTLISLSGNQKLQVQPKHYMRFTNPFDICYGTLAKGYSFRTSDSTKLSHLHNIHQNHNLVLSNCLMRAMFSSKMRSRVGIVMDFAHSVEKDEKKVDRPTISVKVEQISF